ncbi:cold shock domain-containing protein [Rhodoferax sp. U11-2br]|uniref:cold shock domain-containing protein n=1 Tax=Rhodoferax sp. U11-2br TaxID=2838878 RepID=UPI001BEB8F74|nr:cold shock domain-containing protein [Rhodoferax sp. U11-2br]MBT3067956.1 cold shock domain-containing protein [Rhodoferax sp. U11-2br]
MSQQAETTVILQSGSVTRLEPQAGFGYVQDSKGENSYIFLFGKAIKHAQVHNLFVGASVAFRVSGQGHVDELVVCHDASH